MDNKGLQRNTQLQKSQSDIASIDTIVLDKTIFSNVFEKDIRRVYIYKKSERLAKAIQLILPAFKDTRSIRDRLSHVALALIDAGVLPPQEAREKLSRELLTLSSVLAVARSGGMLSAMNTEIISREAHNLLQEVAGYDDQRVTLEDMPSLSAFVKSAQGSGKGHIVTKKMSDNTANDKGHGVKQLPKTSKNGRTDSVLSILKSKGPSRIKDISMLIRDVSEKTIQRELQNLISQGLVQKEGERRWTIYTYIGVGDTESKSA